MRARLEAMHAAAVGCLSRAHHAVDDYTARHEDRVGALAGILARFVGVPEAEAWAIGHAARLHDIGKIGIPPRILHKPGPLTPEERVHVERHPLLGANILRAAGSAFFTLAADIAQHHHERADGSGYPNGLRGEEIPLHGRIVGLCDVYEALREERSYKAGLSHDLALKVLGEGDGRTSPGHFDQRVLAVFLDNGDLIATEYARMCEHADPQPRLGNEGHVMAFPSGRTPDGRAPRPDRAGRVRGREGTGPPAQAAAGGGR